MVVLAEDGAEVAAVCLVSGVPQLLDRIGSLERFSFFFDLVGRGVLPLVFEVDKMFKPLLPLGFQMDLLQFFLDLLLVSGTHDQVKLETLLFQVELLQVQLTQLPVPSVLALALVAVDHGLVRLPQVIAHIRNLVRDSVWVLLDVGKSIGVRLAARPLRGTGGIHAEAALNVAGGFFAGGILCCLQSALPEWQLPLPPALQSARRRSAGGSDTLEAEARVDLSLLWLLVQALLLKHDIGINLGLRSFVLQPLVLEYQLGGIYLQVGLLSAVHFCALQSHFGIFCSRQLL